MARSGHGKRWALETAHIPGHCYIPLSFTSPSSALSGVPSMPGPSEDVWCVVLEGLLKDLPLQIRSHVNIYI